MRPTPSRLAALVAVLTAVGFGACASDGTAPAVTFSIALADGRTCHDAAVIDVAVARGSTDYADFLCQDAEAPMTVTIDKLPLSDRVDVLGGSAQGATLYIGSFVASDLVGLKTPPTIELDPYDAR